MRELVRVRPLISLPPIECAQPLGLAVHGHDPEDRDFFDLFPTVGWEEMSDVSANHVGMFDPPSCESTDDWPIPSSVRAPFIKGAITSPRAVISFT